MISYFTNTNLNTNPKQNERLQKALKQRNGKLLFLYVCLCFVVIDFIQVCVAYCDSYSEVSPDNNHKIVWTCERDYNTSSIYTSNCNMYALDAIGKKNWIHRKSDFPEPTVKWHNNSLAEIHLPCGSPCYYSIFYDINKGLTAPYEFVLAVNADKYVIARVDKSNIVINRIFQKADNTIMKINRKFSKTASLVLIIKEAHFTKSGKLFIRYLSGKHYVPKEETIPVNY